MASLSLAPANLSLVCVDGDDLSLSFTITEDGVAYDWTGATVVSVILTLAGAAAEVSSFTTATPTNGTLTASLTDAQTETLGPGTYRFAVKITKSSLTRTIMAGSLSVMEVGYGGDGVSTGATLNISTGTGTVAVTGQVTANAAANITVADTAGLYAGSNVETVLAEVGTNYTTLTRFNRQQFLPTAAIAQTVARSDAISNISPLSSGRLSFHLMWIPAGTINSITFVSANTAATTPSNQWFAIYDASTRAKLAVTNDDTTTAWAANTAKTLTIAGGVTLTEGYYYVGIMVAAAAVPSLYGVSTSASTTVTVLPPIITGADTTNTGLTTPATAPATAAALTGSTLAPYAYVS